MTKITITNTPIEGLFILERSPITDIRGLFERLFCSDHLAPIFGGRTIRQINRSVTKRKGCLRGLHFQRPPRSELKLVTCIKGSVFDVAVDIRKGSPTFLQSYAIVLSPESNRSFLIPEGFAHGFQTLKSNSEMLYFHTEPHSIECEGGLNALDPRLCIGWPLNITERSTRDSRELFIDDEFEGI